MEKEIKIVINEQTGRLDKVLAEQLKESRSKIQQWLQDGAVLLEGRPVKANYKVKSGDQILITLPEAKSLELLPQNIKLDIVYEDEDVAVVNKPQGMVVHPSPGHPQDTLVNALLYHLDNLSTINDVIRPGIVHRIDKDTSGLLMIAKNDVAHASLAQQLKNKTSTRKYIALVHGTISHEKGTINAPIGRSTVDRKKQAVMENGKTAVTHFTVLERFENYTLLELQLETGRTHQIRVHMQYIDHPVAGDPIYGPKHTLKGNGQFLHAQELGFTHPRTGEKMLFSAPLPKIFEEKINFLREID
ncbi:MAG TPA: RluA family pseudouridine synthase [Candidatus Tetragenococcus pullicola]|nr:RluA family pseudouridine synthase [Candidatus Tetragenococcus pullicola]